MAKIAILGDLHLGVRAGNKHFLDFQREWLKYFLEKCKELKVSAIIQAGDFFDVRKSIDGRVLDYVQDEFKHMTSVACIPWYVIVGNHDIYYRESNKIFNTKVLRTNPLFTVFSEPADIVLGNTSFLMLPWIDSAANMNLEKTLASSGSSDVIGHLELSGFPMYAGVVQEHGLSLDLFKKFERVWSGHYHTISKRQNVQYIGAPYHLTWADVVDDVNRGFFVFDTDTKESVLVKNEPWMSLFRVFEYDMKAAYDQVKLNEELEGCVVKVIVKEKDPRHLAAFVKMLNNVDLIDFRIIDETILKSTKTEDISKETLSLDTVQVFSACIDADENVGTDKGLVKEYMKDVYTRAVAVAAI